jgi:hypothetical protein
MTTFENLAIRIKLDTGLDLGNFRRLRPGYWQRSQGAWKWSANQIIDGKISNALDIGSQWSATDLLKQEARLVIYISLFRVHGMDEIIPGD